MRAEGFEVCEDFKPPLRGPQEADDDAQVVHGLGEAVPRVARHDEVPVAALEPEARELDLLPTLELAAREALLRGGRLPVEVDVVALVDGEALEADDEEPLLPALDDPVAPALRALEGRARLARLLPSAAGHRDEAGGLAGGR